MCFHDQREGQIHVAPRVGAWIEIGEYPARNASLLSLPVWERGLKSCTRAEYWEMLESLPVWERGLKSWSPDGDRRPWEVAPHAGAWIEIIDSDGAYLTIASLPMRERGLKFCHGYKCVP